MPDAFVSCNAAESKVLACQVTHPLRSYFTMCFFFHDLQQLSRKAAFRRVVYRTAQRAREIKVKAFQRWRLAAAAAAMTNPRQQQLKKDLRRGAVMAEAILKRQDGAVQLAGFQRWKNADAKVKGEGRCNH